MNPNTHRRTLASMILTAFLLTALPVGSAGHCSELLGSPEWICHPEPDTKFDLSDCLESCTTQTFEEVDPTGALPETQVVDVTDVRPMAWHVLCDVQISTHTFRFDQVNTGDAPACVTGTLVRVEGRLTPSVQTGVGAEQYTLEFGECALTVKAEVYGGLGLNEYQTPVACATLS